MWGVEGAMTCSRSPSKSLAEAGQEPGVLIAPGMCGGSSSLALSQTPFSSRVNLDMFLDVLERECVQPRLAGEIFSSSTFILNIFK